MPNYSHGTVRLFLDRGPPRAKLYPMTSEQGFTVKKHFLDGVLAALEVRRNSGEPPCSVLELQDHLRAYMPEFTDAFEWRPCASATWFTTKAWENWLAED